MQEYMIKNNKSRVLILNLAKHLKEYCTIIGKIITTKIKHCILIADIIAATNKITAGNKASNGICRAPCNHGTLSRS